jgi:hypothetical protein
LRAKSGARAKALGPRFRGDDEMVCFCFSSLASRVPLGRGEGAEEKARRGARTTRARSLAGQGWPVSEPPKRPRAVAGFTGDRGRVGRLSLVTFSGETEKVTRPPWMADETPQGRESAFVQTSHEQNKEQQRKEQRQRQDQERPSPCPLPQAGEGKSLSPLPLAGGGNRPSGRGKGKPRRQAGAQERLRGVRPRARQGKNARRASPTEGAKEEQRKSPACAGLFLDTWIGTGITNPDSRP